MSAPPPYDRRALFGWAMYDFAISSFNTLVLTFIYATYFTQAIAPDDLTGTAMWGTSVLVAAVFIVLLSPLLGAMADRGGHRKRFLLLASAVVMLATAASFFALPGQVLFALTCMVVANVAFEICGVFYNAFLPDLAPQARIGRISGIGWATGYVGGLLCMVLALVVFVQPETAPFGLDKATGEHIRATNLLVVAWIGLFILPFFLFVREKPAADRLPLGQLVRATFQQLGQTARELRQYRQIIRLLVARFFYNDGLNTIFQFGGIFAAAAYGFTTSEILVFGIVLNITAALGAFAFGFVDDRIGAKTTIFIALGLLTVAALGAVAGTEKLHLWIAGTLIGIASGPCQASSRSLLGRFVPASKETEFFGFFAFTGRLSAFIGPPLFGWLTVAFGTQKAGVALVVALFALGALLLTRVNEREGIAASGR